MQNYFKLHQERHHPVPGREICTNRCHTSDDTAPTGLVICWDEGFYKDAAPTALGVVTISGVCNSRMKGPKPEPALVANVEPRPGRHLCRTRCKIFLSSVRSGIFRTTVCKSHTNRGHTPDDAAPTGLVIFFGAVSTKMPRLRRCE